MGKPTETQKSEKKKKWKDLQKCWWRQAWFVHFPQENGHVGGSADVSNESVACAAGVFCAHACTLNLQKKNPGALSFGGPNPANYQNLKPSKALLGQKKLKHNGIFDGG